MAIANVILILCFIRVSPLLAARDLPFDRRRESATCCDEPGRQIEKRSASPSGRFGFIGTVSKSPNQEGRAFRDLLRTEPLYGSDYFGSARALAGEITMNSKASEEEFRLESFRTALFIYSARNI